MSVCEYVPVVEELLNTFYFAVPLQNGKQNCLENFNGVWIMSEKTDLQVYDNLTNGNKYMCITSRLEMVF